jgi:hypothetical protein
MQTLIGKLPAMTAEEQEALDRCGRLVHDSLLVSFIVQILLLKQGHSLRKKADSEKGGTYSPSIKLLPLGAQQIVTLLIIQKAPTLKLEQFHKLRLCL